MPEQSVYLVKNIKDEVKGKQLSIDTNYGEFLSSRITFYVHPNFQKKKVLNHSGSAQSFDPIIRLVSITGSRISSNKTTTQSFSSPNKSYNIGLETLDLNHDSWLLIPPESTTCLILNLAAG